MLYGVLSYVNHTCDKQRLRWSLDRCNMRVRIKAKSNISILPGEEITFDYGTSETDVWQVMECRCGAANCRGAVHWDDYRLPELQERYGRHFQPYINARIEREAAGLPVEVMEKPLSTLATSYCSHEDSTISRTLRSYSRRFS